MKDIYIRLATCPIKDVYIRDMIAKCFYDTANHASYDLETGKVFLHGQIKESWRVIIKGKRVRLEYKKEL